MAHVGMLSSNPTYPAEVRMRDHVLLILLALAGSACTEKHASATGPCVVQPCAAGSSWSSTRCVCQAEQAGASTAGAGGSSAGASAQGAAGGCASPVCPLGATWNAASCSCQSSSVAGCELVPEVDKRAPGPNLADCGTLQLDATQDAREQARRCVLDALAARQPFKLVQWKMGTDTRIASAYAWPGAAGFVSILSYDSGLSGASIDEQTCRSLRSDSPCVASATDLCLECAEPIESSVACSPASKECRGAGNYETGKEGGYQPCCAGLREVFQLSAAYAGDDEHHQCVQEPLRVSACIEGQCGDGRCEAAEAVHCGCTLDCPSAVWGDSDAGI
jgi:hypothetical protein